MIDWFVKTFRGAKLRKLVLGAIELLGTEHMITVDRVFEVAVHAAASKLGIRVDAREVRLAVARLRMEHETARLKAEAEKLLANIERRQREGRP